jgi:hypothetical protein
VDREEGHVALKKIIFLLLEEINVPILFFLQSFRRGGQVDT